LPDGPRCSGKRQGNRSWVAVMLGEVPRQRLPGDAVGPRCSDGFRMSVRPCLAVRRRFPLAFPYPANFKRARRSRVTGRRRRGGGGCFTFPYKARAIGLRFVCSWRGTSFCDVRSGWLRHRPSLGPSQAPPIPDAGSSHRRSRAGVSGAVPGRVVHDRELVLTSQPFSSTSTVALSTSTTVLTHNCLIVFRVGLFSSSSPAKSGLVAAMRRASSSVAGGNHGRSPMGQIRLLRNGSPAGSSRGRKTAKKNPFLAAKLQNSREFRPALRGSGFLPLIQSPK